jgi:hypothetical protein
MDKAFERVLELFGKPNDDGLFAQFIDDLGEKPEIILQTDRVTEYDFGRFGLHLSYMLNSLTDLSNGSSFNYAIFSLGPDSKAFSSRRSYLGNLPYGIKRGDSRTDVAKKLGIPADLNDYEILFEDSDCKLSFYFSRSLELCLLSVWYDPELL